MKNKTSSIYVVDMKVLFQDERPFVEAESINLKKAFEARNTSNAIDIAIKSWSDNYPELTHDNILSVIVEKR